MRVLLVVPCLLANLALADVAAPVAAEPVGAVGAVDGPALVDVKLDELDELEAAPAYDKSRWLLLLPLLCALVVVWNVDWRDVRARAERAAARAQRAPRVRQPTPTTKTGAS